MYTKDKMERNECKMNKILYKSNSNRVLTGVCGGIGEYLNLDPTLVRIIVIIATPFTGFTTIIAYIIAAIIIPEENIMQTNNTQANQQDKSENIDDSYHDKPNKSNNINNEKTLFYIGGILLCIGILAILKEIFKSIGFGDVILPAILLIIGGIFIYRAYKDSKEKPE
jgi:phage shock protein C